MEAKEIKGLTVQELCDKLTVLCHNGHAQAIVRHSAGLEVLPVTDISMIGDAIALLRSNGEVV